MTTQSSPEDVDEALEQTIDALIASELSKKAAMATRPRFVITVSEGLPVKRVIGEDEQWPRTGAS